MERNIRSVVPISPTVYNLSSDFRVRGALCSPSGEKAKSLRSRTGSLTRTGTCICVILSKTIAFVLSATRQSDDTVAFAPYSDTRR